MRGRGLKPWAIEVKDSGRWSPPVRGRGLKLHGVCAIVGARRVAPRAGARIETMRSRLIIRTGRTSPPVRGRGLKLRGEVEEDRHVSPDFRFGCGTVRPRQVGAP